MWMDLRFVCFNSKWQCWWRCMGASSLPIGLRFGSTWTICMKIVKQCVFSWRWERNLETHCQYASVEANMIGFGDVMINNQVDKWWMDSVPKGWWWCSHSALVIIFVGYTIWFSVLANQDENFANFPDSKLIDYTMLQIDTAHVQCINANWKTCKDLSDTLKQTLKTKSINWCFKLKSIWRNTFFPLSIVCAQSYPLEHFKYMTRRLHWLFIWKDFITAALWIISLFITYLFKRFITLIWNVCATQLMVVYIKRIGITRYSSTRARISLHL